MSYQNNHLFFHQHMGQILSSRCVYKVKVTNNVFLRSKNNVNTRKNKKNHLKTRAKILFCLQTLRFYGKINYKMYLQSNKIFVFISKHPSENVENSVEL